MVDFYGSINDMGEHDKGIIKAVPLYSRVVRPSRDSQSLVVLGMAYDADVKGSRYFMKVSWSNNNEVDVIDVLFNSMAIAGAPLYLLGDKRFNVVNDALSFYVDGLADREAGIIIADNDSEVRDLERFLESLRAEGK